MVKNVQISDVYWKLAKRMISGEYEMTSIKDVVEVALDRLAESKGIPRVEDV